MRSFQAVVDGKQVVAVNWNLTPIPGDFRDFRDPHPGLPWSQHGTKLQCMRVIATSTLRDFWERHPDAEQPLKAWYEEVKNANWTQPGDIKTHYRSASVLKNRRVVFNIKGNDYRLIVAVAYRLQIVYVKFVGTHKAYDAVDADTVDAA